MTIKQHGGIFGRNPNFNSITLSNGTALDRYEQGTWTPNPQDSSGNSGTASIANGNYTRIGNLVLLSFALENIDTTGLTAGQDFRIVGLPYNSASIPAAQYFTGSLRANFVTFTGGVSLHLLDSTNFLRIGEIASGAATDYVTVSEIASGTADIYGSIMYVAE